MYPLSSAAARIPESAKKGAAKQFLCFGCTSAVVRFCSGTEETEDTELKFWI